MTEQQQALDYLTRKGTNAPIDALRKQVRETFAAIEREFDAVAEPQRDKAPAPGKWSPHEILDHLVLSHEPAIAQLESLLRGVSPGGVAIPAGLHRDERPEWAEVRRQLGEVHAAMLALIDGASEAHSLEPKAVVEIVVNGKHWFEPLDWKAFVQAVRVHTIEHRNQLQRALTSA